MYSSIVKYRKAALLLLFTVLVQRSLFSQQDPLFFHYRQDASVINPAFSGAEGMSFLSLASRWQWVGIKGAPSTHVFSGNFALPKGFGAGFQAMADIIGPSQQYRLNADVAYHIPLSRKIKLSAGVRGTLSMMNVNMTDLHVTDPNDPAYFQNVFSGALFNVGGGLLLHSNNYFVGVSIPSVLEFNLLESQSSDARYTYLRHYFVTGGGNIILNRNWQMRLSTVLRFSAHSSVQADINVAAEFRKQFMFGIMYRTMDAFAVNLGCIIARKFHIFYQYEIPMSELVRTTVQTHNVGLRFDINPDKLRQIHSPRFFF